MTFNIPTGITGEQSLIVRKKDTAEKYGSGLVEVFATPAMIGLMEQTAQKCIMKYLPDGFTTVGIAVDIRHLKATPVGMKVTCHATLTAAEGRKLRFTVQAWDEEGMIGSGNHTRYIVNTEEFLSKIKR
jgi:fluoroacetyl-CoA thioesterase